MYSQFISGTRRIAVCCSGVFVLLAMACADAVDSPVDQDTTASSSVNDVAEPTAAGSGGSYNSTGSATYALTAPKLVISTALRADKTTVRPGDTLSASVTYRNASSTPVTIVAITIAGRAPGASHAGGPYTDLTPSQARTTLAPGASVTLKASRKFKASDPAGRWELYATYQDTTWHDGPSLYFTVSASCAPESDQTFCARTNKRCGAVSGLDNCGATRQVQSCGSCGAGQSCNASNQCATGTTPPPPPPSAAMKIGTNFWYHTANEDNWSGETSMKSGVDWSSAYGSGTNGLAATNVWNATFINELAPYSTLRFMDWGNTNFSKITSWSQRRLPSDPGNYAVYIDAGSPVNNPGIAYEWMIDLGNRTHKDIWICVPAQADENYWTQLAVLIKNKLQVGRKVYIEYSNETWNGSFSQFQYMLDRGMAQNLPGSNQWYKGEAYAVWQSVKMFKAFEAVFGASAMGSRVVRVFAYGGNMDTGRSALQSIYKSATYNPTNQKIDMLAIAPYIGSDLDGASTTIRSQFHTAIDEQASAGEAIAFAVHDQQTFGIAKLGTYEGGQQLYKNSKAWSSNPQIYAEYTYMLNRWSQYFSLFTHYTHTSKWTNAQDQSSWGAKDHTGQPLAEAHKYRALVDWANAQP